MQMIEPNTQQPLEVFPRGGGPDEVDLRSRGPALAVRAAIAGFLPPDVAESVSDWYTEEPAPLTEAVRRAYGALERETGRLFGVVRRCLGVRIRYVHTADEPYDSRRGALRRPPRAAVR